MMFLRWIGGGLSGAAGSGVVIGTTMIVFGMTPGEIVVHMTANMPDWVFGEWFKLALVVAGMAIIFASFRFNVWSRRQKAVNELADLLSDAIHDLLNRTVAKDAELGQLKADIRDWQKDVLSKIDSYPSYFSKADRIHFDHLGAIIEMPWKQAYRSNPSDDRHNHELNMLSLKFDRLRDIINWTQQRTR